MNIEIELRLMEKGISKEELVRFARLPKHNGKKDIFREIAMKPNWPTPPKGLAENLMYVLAEKGIEDFGELNIDGRRKRYLGEDRYNLLVAQSVASKMLGVLSTKDCKQYDSSLTLDKIYELIK